MIRVLLTGMTRMLSEIMAELIRAQRDMEVAGQVVAGEALADAVRRTRPHVLVVGAVRGELPARCRELVRDTPRLRVLGVESDGRRAWLYEMRPYQVPMGEVSPDDILAAIRGAPSLAGAPAVAEERS